MKKTIYYLLFFFFITISQSLSEIVYIDINKILNDSIEGKKALGELEKNIKERNEFFSSTEKKLIEEEKKIMTQKNILFALCARSAIFHFQWSCLGSK